MLNLRSEDDCQTFEPGERLELTAEWRLDEQVEAIELRLLWHTSGKGDSDVSVLETIRFDSPGQIETRSATFQLPEAPYSFSGKLITLAWAVEMVALPSAEMKTFDFVLAPEGREVSLFSSGESQVVAGDLSDGANDDED